MKSAKLLLSALLLLVGITACYDDYTTITKELIWLCCSKAAANCD